MAKILYFYTLIVEKKRPLTKSEDAKMRGSTSIYLSKDRPQAIKLTNGAFYCFHKCAYLGTFSRQPFCLVIQQ